MRKLTEMAIKKAKPEAKAYKMSDGGGMFLIVQPTGSKWWRLKYRFLGVEKLLSLGVYPDVTLAEARDRREQARKLLANGVDPNAVKQEAKKASHRALKMASENSFATLAREYHKMKIPMWTVGHAKQWLGNMEKYAFPVIGNIQIDKIEPMDIIGILRGMEKEKTFETRDRLGQSISAVFKYSIAMGLVKQNPAAEIRMALADRPKVEHFPCISTAEVPAFLRAVSAYQNKDITVNMT